MSSAFSLEQLRQFEAVVRQEIPAFKIAFKETTWHQRFLGMILSPFNDKYMTSYTTTMHPVVYFPSPAAYEKDPFSSFVTLAHELVHLVDTKKRPWHFRLSYLFPQVLAPLPLAAFVLLTGVNMWAVSLTLVAVAVGVMMSKVSRLAQLALLAIAVIGTFAFAFVVYGFLSLLLVASAACLAPWPSPGRTEAELRGYAVNLAVRQWMHGSVEASHVNWVRSHFNGPSYYFMSWNAGHVQRCLLDIVASAANGSLQKDYPYDVIYRFMQTSGLLNAKPGG